MAITEKTPRGLFLTASEQAENLLRTVREQYVYDVPALPDMPGDDIRLLMIATVINSMANLDRDGNQYRRSDGRARASSMLHEAMGDEWPEVDLTDFWKLYAGQNHAEIGRRLVAAFERHWKPRMVEFVTERGFK